MTEDFIQNIQFDLFAVELVIGETATLLMAENYVTIREVFVDGVKVEPNEEKQIFLSNGGDNLWEIGEGNTLQPKENKTFTIKKANEVDAVGGSTDKFLNKQGDFTKPTISHIDLTYKNDETAYQHIDTTTTKQTLVEADKVAVYDSVTGKVVLTDKNNVGLGVSGADALEAEVFEGKTSIANSISDKGIPATSADTFSILANKITQIENTPPEPQVIAALDSLNGEIIQGTSLDKINAAIGSKSAIAVELENSGIEMDGKPLSGYAPMLRWALGTLGVYILGSDNAEYTAAEWRIIKNNPAPPAAIGVILRSTSQSFIISIDEVSKTFDVYGKLIPNLTNFTSNQNLYKDLDGYTNSLRIMQFANPAMLTEAQGVYKYSSLANFPSVGLSGLIYLDLSTNKAYWWVEGQYLDQGVKPYVDSRSMVGSQATEYAWNYKAYVGDTRQWYLPSIGQLMLVFANNIAINDCLNAINNLQLNTGNWWSSTQSAATYMWYLAGSNGGVGGNLRTYSSVVRAVSAY